MGVRQSLSTLAWTVISRGRIVGSDFYISLAARVHVNPGAVLSVGRGAHISGGVRIVVHKDSFIGPDVFLGRNATVVALSSLAIGAGTLIGENVSIHTENHRGRSLSDFTTAAVSIGERCWLCAGVVVTEGAWIGDETVVGANSVVTSFLPGGMVAAGVPARPVGPRRDL